MVGGGGWEAADLDPASAGHASHIYLLCDVMARLAASQGFKADSEDRHQLYALGGNIPLSGNM